MPCPIIENAKYPNYLETILKTIQVENNDELKSCACNLVSPTRLDGCPIIFDTNKLGLFKSCLDRDSSLVYTVYDSFETFETSIVDSKNSLAIWWLLKSIKFTATWDIYIDEFNNGSGVDTYEISNGTNGIGEEYLTIRPKKRVCLNSERFFSTPPPSLNTSIYSSVWPFILNDEEIAVSLSFSVLAEEIAGSTGFMWVITTYPYDLVPVLNLDPDIYSDDNIQNLAIPPNKWGINGNLYGHSVFYNADWPNTVGADPATFPSRSSSITLDEVKFWDSI